MSTIEEQQPSSPVDDVETSGSTATRQRDRIDVGVVLALPIVLLVVLRVSPYFRINNGDPFIYTGYANDFRGHVERFGYTYHSVRFGLIFPLRASLIFGQVWGYFILRYLLYAVAIVPMHFVLRPLGRRAALLGPTLFVANPVTALAILSTHPDTIVVPLYVATTCVLVLACRRGRGAMMLLAGLAGLGAGLAVNANIFFAPLMAISMAVIVVALVLERRITDVLRVGVPFAAAVAAVCIAGMLVYRAMFGDANIYRTTFNAIRDIHSNDLWKAPSRIWLTTRRYVYAPPLVAVAGVAAVVRSRRRPRNELIERGLIVGLLVAPLLFYFVHEFLLQGTSIETSYYYSYIIGPTCMVAAAAFGWAKMKRVIPMALVVIVPVVLAYVSQLVEIRRFAFFVIIMAAAALAVIRTPAVAAILALVAATNIAWGSAPRHIAAIPNATYQYEPHYEIAFGDVDDSGFEAFELASRLPSVVPSNPGAPEPLLFWYRSGDALLDSVEASYHWETLAVQRAPQPGMPVISPGDMDRLKALVGGYVVLIGRQQSELDAGVRSLADTGFVVEPDATRRLAADDSAVLVEPVKVVSAPS